MPLYEIGSTPLLIDSSLKAYYKMSTGALTTDSSGNSKTLTNVNTVADGTGFFGGAASLGTSNTTKYLYIDDALGIDGGNMSMTLWVKLLTEVDGTSLNYVFASCGNDTSMTKYKMRYEYNAGTPRLNFMRTRNGTADDSAFYTVTLGTTNWIHLGLVYDGTNVNIYTNGTYRAQVAASGSGSLAGYDVTTIGAQKTDLGAISQYASALIDDVAIFSRALTAAEMFKIYNGTWGFMTLNKGWR